MDQAELYSKQNMEQLARLLLKLWGPVQAMERATLMTAHVDNPIAGAEFMLIMDRLTTIGF